MKKKNKIFISISCAYILLGLLLLAVSLFAVKGKIKDIMFSSNKIEKKYAIEQEFEKININSTFGDIEFAISENGENYVLCLEEQDEQNYSIKAEKGILDINFIHPRDDWYDFIGTTDPDVTVYLSKQNYSELNIVGSSADLIISDKFSFFDAKIKTSSGDIDFNANIDNNLEIATSSGEINVGGKVNNLSIKSSSGDIKINSQVNGKLYIETESGEIELNNVIASEIECKTSSGDIELSNCDANKLKFESASGDIEGTLKSPKLFIAKSSSGDISVPIQNAENICEITTSSGDINFSITN